MDDFEKARRHFIEGLQLLEANNFQAAETQFTRSLDLLPGRVSTLNNLAAVKLRLGKHADAEALALKAIAAGDPSPEAWSNLGIARAAAHRHEEALQAYDRALDCNAAYPKAWLNKAMSLLELKRHDAAWAACDQALKLNPGHAEALLVKSRILKELERPGEAQQTYRLWLEMKLATSPVFIAERRATQKAEILIISHDPVLDGSLKSFEVLHLFSLNFPSQLALLFQDEFHFSIVLEGNAAKASIRRQIPPPDLVLNNCANGELVQSGGKLAGLTALVESFGVPVINHPAKVIQTTRDGTAKLLEGVTGVLVPKIGRFSSAGKAPEMLVDEIEGQFSYPFITRTLTAQEGKGMTKVDSRKALVTALGGGLPEKFAVTQFVDSRESDGFYRKIRAVVVKDEIIVARVDYDVNWNVHGRKSDERVAFYSGNAGRRLPTMITR